MRVINREISIGMIFVIRKNASLIVHKISWAMTTVDMINNIEFLEFDDISMNIWSSDTFEGSVLIYWTSLITQCAEK